MLHDFFLMPVASLLLATSAQPAQPAKECQGYTPQIEVFTVFPHVESDHSLRSVEIESSDAWGMLMVDHIATQTKLMAQPEFRSLKKRGIDCDIMTKATVIFRLENKVQVLNRYPEGSCQHRQVQEHIDKHIQVAKDFQQQSVPLIQEYLVKMMTGKAGAEKVSARADTTGKPEVQKLLNDHLGVYARYLGDEQRKLQKQMLDNPDEVKKLFAPCPGWKAPQYME